MEKFETLADYRAFLEKSAQALLYEFVQNSVDEDEKREIVTECLEIGRKLKDLAIVEKMTTKGIEVYRV